MATIKTDGPLRKLEISRRGRKTSWEATGEGKEGALATIEFETHATAGWTQVVLCEHGAKVTRETHITLDAADRKLLAEFLRGG